MIGFQDALTLHAQPILAEGQLDDPLALGLIADQAAVVPGQAIEGLEGQAGRIAQFVLLIRFGIQPAKALLMGHIERADFVVGDAVGEDHRLAQGQFAQQTGFPVQFQHPGLYRLGDEHPSLIGDGDVVEPHLSVQLGPMAADQPAAVQIEGEQLRAPFVVGIGDAHRQHAVQIGRDHPKQIVGFIHFHAQGAPQAILCLTLEVAHRAVGPHRDNLAAVGAADVCDPAARVKGHALRDQVRLGDEGVAMAERHPRGRRLFRAQWLAGAGVGDQQPAAVIAASIAGFPGELHKLTRCFYSRIGGVQFNQLLHSHAGD